MAKRGARPVVGAALLPFLGEEASASTPAPQDGLHVTRTLIPKGDLLHRVHHSKYLADQFNAGKNGNARFSPIQDELGKPIPTLYVGTTMACALMETVFHDVPHTAGFKSFDKGKLVQQLHFNVRVEQELQVGAGTCRSNWRQRRTRKTVPLMETPSAVLL